MALFRTIVLVAGLVGLLAGLSLTALQAFTKAFRERYHNDVDEYALLGFDVTMAYVRAAAQYGPQFMDHLGDAEVRPLHMGLRMTRTGPENGFRNEFAVMLKQQELRLVKAQ